MYTVHGTAKLLTRLKRPPQSPVEATTALGNWYGTTVPWRPQVALMVNERTLLPVFMLLAPAKSLLDRFPAQLAAVLTQLATPAEFIDDELAAMNSSGTYAKTANRSVVGSMVDFVFLADHHQHHPNTTAGLIELSVRLSVTPCSPLDKSHGSPDRALAALTQTR